MKKIYRYKSGFTLVELVIVIAIVAILAAVLIPTFSNVITSAQIAKHQSNAQSIYSEYRLKNISNNNVIDDLAIKTDEDVYVIYVDGKVIDGIYSYDEVKEKFKYSLVKKYDQDNNILLVYDYDVNNPNCYSKISVDIKDDQTFTTFMFHIKLNDDLDVDSYNNLVDYYYSIFMNYYGDHLAIDITSYIDKEIFNQYVIVAIYRDEFMNLDFNYSDLEILENYDFSIIANENKSNESYKKYIDFIFIPKFFVYDSLEMINKPSGEYFSNSCINYIINKETIPKKSVYYNLVRWTYEKEN